ncbi:hypothetical protein H0V99_00265 [Candidatus Saccharibacteria bacterium]|nr:hypothetical protein [Candidatus Saccharibacteria bacterium]
MSLFESVHPLGQEVETIQSALAAGLISDDLKLPEHLRIAYTDPLTSGDGVGVLRIADWQTDNVTQVLFPILPNVEDTTWEIHSNEGPLSVRQRIFTRDVLGRNFPVTLNKNPVETPYLQFDLVDEGVVFSVQDQDEQKVAFGGFESECYEMLAKLARHTSSIRAVLQLAIEY